jgi:hypothetical protein
LFDWFFIHRVIIIKKYKECNLKISFHQPASLNLPTDAVTRLSENGIYAMGMSDEVMEILNDDQCVYQRTSQKAKLEDILIKS